MRMYVLAALVLLTSPLASQEAKKVAKPVLEVKIFPLKQAETGLTTNVLEALLGEQDMVIEKVKQPNNPVPGLGNQLPDITAPLWRVATDSRSRTVIFRGTAAHLATASEIVAVLDRKDDQPLPGTKAIHAFQLKRTTSGEVSNVLDALEFENLRKANAGETMLIVVGPEDVVKTVAAIVAAMDVEKK